MDQLPTSPRTRYLWDRARSHSNWVREGVAFSTAVELLSCRTSSFDIGPTEFENRLLTIGPFGSRLLVVCSSEPRQHVVHVLGARHATRTESALYHQVLNEWTSSSVFSAVFSAVFGETEMRETFGADFRPSVGSSPEERPPMHRGTVSATNRTSAAERAPGVRARTHAPIPNQRLSRRHLGSAIAELTAEQVARSIPRELRRRLVQGDIPNPEDIAVLRRFAQLSPSHFARG